MTILVKVTAKHVSDGQRNLCHVCPIALAIRDEMKRLKLPKKSVWVDRSHCWIGDTMYPLPAVAVAFIKRFDSCYDALERAAIPPLEFPLEIDLAA